MIFVWLMAWFCFFNSFSKVRRLLFVHLSSDSGSPGEEASTSASKSFSTVASGSRIFLRPPPGCRSRFSGSLTPVSSSRIPFDETWRAEGEVEEPAIAGRRPGEAGDASRRIVIVGAVSHRIGVRRGGRRTNRGVITCRVMRVHFGDTMAEMHHEHSDTPETDK